MDYFTVMAALEQHQYLRVAAIILVGMLIFFIIKRLLKMVFYVVLLCVILAGYLHYKGKNILETAQKVKDKTTQLVDEAAPLK